MPRNTVLELEIGDGSCPYREFLDSVQRSGDLKALSIIDRIVGNLIQEGLALLNTNMMDNIEDDIYECRVKAVLSGITLADPGCYLLD